MKIGRWVALGLALLLVSAPAMAKKTNQELVDEVRAAETAFAKTMADRDLKGFATYVSNETIFYGGKGPIRGRDKVVEAWARFYEGPAAPFSWAPETVEVLDSGTLALSSGPVHDPEGKLVNRFNSIWRLEKDGKWRVIFDKGCPVCEAETKP